MYILGAIKELVFFSLFLLCQSIIFCLLKYLTSDGKKLERKASFCHTYLISKNRGVKESAEENRKKKGMTCSSVILVITISLFPVSIRFI